MTSGSAEPSSGAPGEPGPDVSLQLTALLLQPSAWVHRRTESVVLLDETTARWTVSVDLTLPIDAPRHPTSGPVVPIAFLRKRDLVHFDLRNEQDDAVPLLTRTQNSDLSAGALLRLAAYDGGDLIDSVVRTSIPVVVRASDAETGERERAWSRIFDARTTVGRYLSGRGPPSLNSDSHLDDSGRASSRSVGRAGL